MNTTELNLLQNFPEGYEPNDAQKYILHEIAIALEQGKKFIILNAPTATGKSFISKTIANYSNEPSDDFIEDVNNFSAFEQDYCWDDEPFGTAVLTVTKSLQEQYSDMFKDGSVLKGKGNYQCEINENVNCEHGNCIFQKNQKKKCIKNDCCPYFKARRAAVLNKCSFYNYSMFNKLSPNAKHKQFIICDEASELEQELVSQYTMEVKMTDLMKLDENMAISPDEGSEKRAYLSWLNSIRSTCESNYNDFIKSVARKKKLKKAEAERLNLLLQYKETTKTIIESWYDTQYIIKHIDGSVLFQPYNVDKLSHNIFDFGETIILMSATIVDHQSFAKTLGIDDYYYIEAQMTLEAKKAPIKVMNRFSLNYRNKEQVLPQMCEVIDCICKEHSGQKGIIHTHSMENLYYIKRYCKDQSRFLFRQNDMTNEELLEMHKSTLLPTILVSPSMTHGVDLKGFLGEFQIIMKAPYLPLGDDRIKMKFDKDKTWYNNAMLSTLIQMCGRCNRSAEDFSITYILDGNVLRAVKQNMKKLPAYFLDRFQ